MASERKRAGRFETLGAWLHVWTPPRDVDVPPVPWRRLLLLGVPALALVSLAMWLIVDDASQTKREREAVEAREEARLAAIERRRLRVEQRAQRARVPPAPRPALVRELEDAVLEDARRRVAAGDLRRPVRRVECEPHPRTEPRRLAEADPSEPRGRYHCLAVTRDIVGTSEGTLGYPFLAKIVYGSGALTWCKVNPPPGEQIVPDARDLETLPSECT
jgi:hypothetical protein